MASVKSRLQQSGRRICIPAGRGAGERWALSQGPLSTPSWHGFGPGREAWRAAQPAHGHPRLGRTEGGVSAEHSVSEPGWSRVVVGTEATKGGPLQAHLGEEGEDEGPWEKGGERV